jgi:hypothetical protein
VRIPLKGAAGAAIIVSGLRILLDPPTPGHVMLVAKFNCPACEAPLKPAAPVPSGKKFKCPKCTRVIVVPSPEDDVEEFEEDIDTVEEVEPVRKRSRPSREGVEEERPGRRRAAREDEEDDELLWD